MSHSKRNFYEILNISSSASFDEIKSNYKQLILQYHPDKLRQQLETDTNNLEINDDTNNSEFIEITQAWNCLRDPFKRKQYDAQLLLNKFRTHINIYAHIKLSEMKKQPNAGECQGAEGAAELDLKESTKEEVSKYLYTYDCRCGGQYIVDESAEQYCRSHNNHDDTQINNSDDNNGAADGGVRADDDANNKSISNNGSVNKIQQQNKNSSNNDGSSSAGGGNQGVVQDNDDVDEKSSGGELIVECSECSLVIILNG